MFGVFTFAFAFVCIRNVMRMVRIEANQKRIRAQRAQRLNNGVANARAPIVHLKAYERRLQELSSKPPAENEYVILDVSKQSNT